MDMPEARDLFACLGAVVSDADGASLFRVAALPQFAIDPEKLRAGIKALPRDAGASAIALVLSQIEGGPAVLERVRQTREKLPPPDARGRAAVDVVVRSFLLDRASRALNAGARVHQRMGGESRSPRPERSASCSTTWNIFARPAGSSPWLRRMTMRSGS